jgi:hypothetical protein
VKLPCSKFDIGLYPAIGRDNNYCHKCGWEEPDHTKFTTYDKSTKKEKKNLSVDSPWGSICSFLGDPENPTRMSIYQYTIQTPLDNIKLWKNMTMVERFNTLKKKLCSYQWSSLISAELVVVLFISILCIMCFYVSSVDEPEEEEKLKVKTVEQPIQDNESFSERDRRRKRDQDSDWSNRSNRAHKKYIDRQRSVLRPDLPSVEEHEQAEFLANQSSAKTTPISKVVQDKIDEQEDNEIYLESIRNMASELIRDFSLEANIRVTEIKDHLLSELDSNKYVIGHDSAGKKKFDTKAQGELINHKLSGLRLELLRTFKHQRYVDLLDELDLKKDEMVVLADALLEEAAAVIRNRDRLVFKTKWDEGAPRFPCNTCKKWGHIASQCPNNINPQKRYDTNIVDEKFDHLFEDIPKREGPVFAKSAIPQLIKKKCFKCGEEVNSRLMWQHNKVCTRRVTDCDWCGSNESNHICEYVPQNRKCIPCGFVCNSRINEKSVPNVMADHRNRCDHAHAQDAQDHKLGLPTNAVKNIQVRESKIPGTALLAGGRIPSYLAIYANGTISEDQRVGWMSKIEVKSATGKSTYMLVCPNHFFDHAGLVIVYKGKIVSPLTKEDVIMHPNLDLSVFKEEAAKELLGYIKGYSVDRTTHEQTLLLPVFREDKWLCSPSKRPWSPQKGIGGENIHWCSSTFSDCGALLETPMGSVVGMHVGCASPDNDKNHLGNKFLYFSDFVMGWLLGQVNGDF